MILINLLLIILFILVINQYVKNLLSNKEGISDPEIQVNTNKYSITDLYAKVKNLEDEMASSESSVLNNTGLISGNSAAILTMQSM